MNIFSEVLLPELREKKLSQSEKKVRILSAGCSTGEEVYTLAMLTFQSGSLFRGWDVQIIGMDINERALEVARQGAYYDRSFRMTDPEYVKKFFSPISGSYQVKNNIRRMTSFVAGNITDTLTWESMKNLDIIFCRNVLIYFSEEKLKTAVNNFCHALREGGYLLLGHSETLIGIFDEFEQQRFTQTIIYRKKEQ